MEIIIKKKHFQLKRMPHMFLLFNLHHMEKLQLLTHLLSIQILIIQELNVCLLIYLQRKMSFKCQIWFLQRI